MQNQKMKMAAEMKMLMHHRSNHDEEDDDVDKEPPTIGKKATPNPRNLDP